LLFCKVRPLLPFRGFSRRARVSDDGHGFFC
jgi:hypothetical protein